MNLSALKAELLAGHPVTGAYSDDHAEALAQLQAENIEQDVETITGQDLFEAVLPAEYFTLNTEQKALFGDIIGMGTIRVNGTNTKAALLAMFGVGTATRDNLAALQKRMISRETELGLGHVRTGDIQRVRK